MIELDHITVSLPPRRPDAKTVLTNITLTVDRGEWVALAGPNGSGKSTLLMTLAGLLPIRAGTLRFRDGLSDRPLAGEDPHDPGVSSKGADSRHEAGSSGPGSVRPAMALLLQEPDNQFVASTVRNELLLSMSPGLGAAAREEAFTSAVERFSLGAFLERNPHRLSGGEKQRLALSTVWLADPAVLLLDEPTSYLDMEERVRCVEFVRELHRRGVSVIWATLGGDDLGEASRIVYLDDGVVRFDGPVAGFERIARSEKWDVMLPGGIPARSGRPRPRAAAVHVGTARGDREEAMVSMRSASFSYGDGDVLHGLNGNIHVGESVGVVGRNGSGKSTLLSLFGGVLEPTGGKIYRKYVKPVERSTRFGRPEQRVFYLFQSPERLFFAETVFEEVAFGLKSLGVDKAELPERVAHALTQVGLEPGEFLERSPFTLSLGEMRRLAFAIAAALRPRFLLLDEPTSCLDAAGHEVLRDLIRSLRSDGSTIVMASSDTSVLDQMTDRLIVVENGRIV